MNNIWTVIELFTIYCFSKFDTNCEFKSKIFHLLLQIDTSKNFSKIKRTLINQDIERRFIAYFAENCKKKSVKI